MQLEIHAAVIAHYPTTRFIVTVDGVANEHFGSREMAMKHQDVLWNARSESDKRIEQYYTGR